MRTVSANSLTALCILLVSGAHAFETSDPPTNPDACGHVVQNSVPVQDLATDVINAAAMVEPTWEGLKPGDLLGTRLYIPISVQNPNQKDLISVQTSSTNTWNPAVPIDGMKLYSADGTVRTLDIRYANNINPRNRVYLNINAFILAHGNTVLDDMMFTSDKSIEAVHSAIVQDNPFQRKSTAFGQANFEVKDDQGRVFKMSAGQSILGTLDVGYVRTIELMNSGSQVVILHMGAVGSASLNALDSRPAVGINQQLTATQKVNAKESITLVLNAAGEYNLPVYLNKNSPHFADHAGDYNYGAALLFARQGQKGGKTTFGVELAGNPPPLEHQPELKKQANAAQYAPGPDNPNRGYTQTRMALTRDEQLFAFGVSRETRSGVTIQVRNVEDMNLAGGGLSGANNRQDFSFYMTVSASSDALKKMFAKKHPNVPLK